MQIYGNRRACLVRSNAAWGRTPSAADWGHLEVQKRIYDSIGSCKVSFLIGLAITHYIFYWFGIQIENTNWFVCYGLSYALYLEREGGPGLGWTTGKMGVNSTKYRAPSKDAGEFVIPRSISDTTDSGHIGPIGWKCSRPTIFIRWIQYPIYAKYTQILACTLVISALLQTFGQLHAPHSHLCHF